MSQTKQRYSDAPRAPRRSFQALHTAAVVTGAGAAGSGADDWQRHREHTRAREGDAAEAGAGGSSGWAPGDLHAAVGGVYPPVLG